MMAESSYKITPQYLTMVLGMAFERVLMPGLWHRAQLLLIPLQFPLLLHHMPLCSTNCPCISIMLKKDHYMKHSI